MNRIPENSIINFEEDAKAYDNFVSFYKFIYDSKSKKALQIQKTGKVLDIGTGNGQVAINFAKWGNFDSIVTLDLSSLMLELAKENARKAGYLEKITFVKGDAQKLDFPDKAFDLVVSYLTMHNLDDVKGFVRETLRVLKPGGSIIIQDLVRPPSFIFPILKIIYTSFLGRNLRTQFEGSLKGALSRKEWVNLADTFKNDGFILRSNYLINMMCLEKISK